MTTIPTSATHDMEFLHTTEADDTMDLASSPHRNPEDEDLDVDVMRDASVEPSHDTMLEDTYLNPHFDRPNMPTEPEVNDDDMLDHDDDTVHEFEFAQDESVIETHGEPNFAIKDEEILYDEEEDETIEDANPQATENLETNETSGFTEEESETKVDIPEAEYDLEEEDLNEEVDGNTNISNPYETQIQTDTRHETEVGGNKLPQDSTILSQHGEEPLHGTKLDQSESTQEVAREAEVSHAEEPGDDPATSNAGTGTLDHQTSINNTLEEPRNDGEDSGMHLLHPVKVLYQDSEICLFPPAQEDTSETYFLSDIALAYESLDRLLLACREILAGTIGDDDELVLDVASLGLHISEDSKYATEITFSQIIDVYLALARNEHTDQIEPLYCTLTSRVCLASQYAYIAAAAQEGKPFTEIAAEHLARSEDSAVEYEEDHEEQLPVEQHLSNEIHHGESEVIEPTHVTPKIDDNHQQRSDGDLTRDELDGADGKDLGPKQQSFNNHSDHAGGDNSLGQSSLEESVALADSGDNSGDQELTTSQDALQENEHQPSPIAPNTYPDEPNHAEFEEELLEDDQDSAEPEDEAGESSHEVNDVGDVDERLESGDDENDFLEEQAEFQYTTNAAGPGLSGDDAETIYANGTVQSNGNAEISAAEGTTKPQAYAEDDLIDLEDEHSTADPSLTNSNGSQEHDEIPEDLFDDAHFESNSVVSDLDHSLRPSDNTRAKVSLTPSTPSKSKMAKRKAQDDDDEFGLLDSFTPEAKRRRPT